MSHELHLPRVKLSKVTIDVVKQTDAKRCVSIARNAYTSGKTKSTEFREKQLKQLARMYEENEDSMLEALAKDLRRPKQEAYLFELNFLKSDLKNVRANFKNWLKPEKPSKDIVFFFDDTSIYNDPFGVVLIIGAWNYPFRASLLPIASAIAAGNCFILNPSKMASASAAFIAEMIPKYLDQECYQVVTDNLEDLLDEKFDYVFYTGEPVMGKLVHTLCSKNLTPTTLIMGGKNPVYMDDSANVEIATRRILWGKCVNAGQTCVGPEYLLCTKEIQAKFLASAKLIFNEFYKSDAKESSDFSRIISTKNFEKLTRFIDDHKVAIGGQYEPKDRYVEPTILIDVNPNSRIMEEEIYGPILPIINVENVQEAIKFINAREKPLSMYIFSTKKQDVDLLLKSTSCGGVTINDTLMHIACDNLPFGGVGLSGIGSYHGKKTFDSFVHKKSVFKRPQSALLEKIETIRYPPYSDVKRKLVRLALMKKPTISLRFLPHILVFLLGASVASAIIYYFDSKTM